jgi:RNA polymerase sigma factor (sigma-70 family)
MDADGDVGATESDEPEPHLAMARTIETERLRTAIEELPAEFREVVVLKDLQGLSYREIAEIVEVPIGTVMSRLSRGRQRLTDRLSVQKGAR